MSTLHTEFSAQTIGEQKVSALDKKICSYIEKHGDILYDAIIADDPDWQVFYQLTELRKGILNWYDFPPDSSVLEIGAGFGTLTGCLCGKCAHVTATDRSLYRAQAIATRYGAVGNLDIYAGEVSEIAFPGAFDYIVLIGLLERVGKGTQDREPYTEYLKSVKKWLKPGGTLLLAVENRFGLRYFCGDAEPHTHRPFDGLNRYPSGASGHSFSRQEIVDVVQAAGFGCHKFYYPLPDYKFPQLIYSDAHLPEKGIREKLIPYYHSRDTLLASERELYYDVIENGVFPFFANSFLLECSAECLFGENGEHGPRDGARHVRTAASGEIVYAAVSTDRGEDRGFATVIRGNGIVHKRPLYEGGRRSARNLYENIMDLQAHGIPVAGHRLLSGDMLELPFIPWPTLSDHIKGIMGDRSGEFLSLIDRVYGYILQSSEQVPAEDNALTPSWKADAAGIPLEKPDFGPILKKAYMELIPLNCFYHAETGEFLYFDQEFVRENYPAKYVLFRAIHYMYCFTPNAERYYPKEKLIEKYGMKDTWEIFFQEEQAFLEEVRNRERYRHFYRRTQVDQGRMYENARQLGTK